MILEQLKDPIEVRWRVQSFSTSKAFATCVAYISSRDVQNRLDKVCSPGMWQTDFRVINDNLYGGIGIKIGSEWVWKWDCGVESQVEKQKGEASDAIKRAAVQWGIGRDTYEMDLFRVRSSEIKTKDNRPFPIDENKKRIWDLTEYINRQLSDYPEWWNNAVDYMKNGGVIEMIEKKYGTLANWAALKKELQNA